MTTVHPSFQRLLTTLVRKGWTDPAILEMLSLCPRDLVYRALMRAHIECLLELIRQIIE